MVNPEDITFTHFRWCAHTMRTESQVKLGNNRRKKRTRCPCLVQLLLLLLSCPYGKLTERTHKEFSSSTCFSLSLSLSLLFTQSIKTTTWYCMYMSSLLYNRVFFEDDVCLSTQILTHHTQIGTYIHTHPDKKSRIKIH